MKKATELIGTFTVRNEDDTINQVFVCQDIINYYLKEKKYTKRLSLYSLYGPEVYATEEPDIFRLDDGTLLRRVKR